MTSILRQLLTSHLLISLSRLLIKSLNLKAEVILALQQFHILLFQLLKASLEKGRCITVSHSVLVLE